MSLKSEVETIRCLEARYAPLTTHGELDGWLSAQLMKSYHNLHDEEGVVFRFREAIIRYVPDSELINATKLVGKDITEHCLLIEKFMYNNYGIRKLNYKRAGCPIQLALDDFVLMGKQIANELITWYENTSLTPLRLNSN